MEECTWMIGDGSLRTDLDLDLTAAFGDSGDASRSSESVVFRLSILFAVFALRSRT